MAPITILVLGEDELEDGDRVLRYDVEWECLSCGFTEWASYTLNEFLVTVKEM